METDNPFEKVLDRLREKGWIKFSLGVPEGPHCIRGAALYELGGWHSLCDALAPLIEAQYPELRLGISPFLDTETNSIVVLTFNDRRQTTFTDVERVLEKAAVRWEEERVMRDE